MHSADLDAVGADVLDRRRAHEPGDEREVLETGEPARQRPVHQRVPADAGLGAHHGGGAVVREDAHVRERRPQHQAGKVRREQHVAALAEHHEPGRGRRAGRAACGRTAAEFKVASQRAVAATRSVLSGASGACSTSVYASGIGAAPRSSRQHPEEGVDRRAVFLQEGTGHRVRLDGGTTSARAGPRRRSGSVTPNMREHRLAHDQERRQQRAVGERRAVGPAAYGAAATKCSQVAEARRRARSVAAGHGRRRRASSGSCCGTARWRAATRTRRGRARSSRARCPLRRAARQAAAARVHVLEVLADHLRLRDRPRRPPRAPASCPSGSAPGTRAT